MNYQIQKHKEKPKIQSVIYWIAASCDTALPQTLTAPSLSGRSLFITSSQKLFCFSPSPMGVALTLKSLMHVSTESTLVRAAQTQYLASWPCLPAGTRFHVVPATWPAGLQAILDMSPISTVTQSPLKTGGVAILSPQAIASHIPTVIIQQT